MILALCGKPCPDKTVHKTFVRQKPLVGLVRVVRLLHKVLSEPCADFFLMDFFNQYDTVYTSRYYTCHVV